MAEYSRKAPRKKTATLIGGAGALLSALGIGIWFFARPHSNLPNEAIEATPSDSANASPALPSATGVGSTNLEPTAPAPTESGASSEPAHSGPSVPSRTRSKARPRGPPKGNERTRTPPSAASSPASPRPRYPDREPQIERNPYVRRK